MNRSSAPSGFPSWLTRVGATQGLPGSPRYGTTRSDNFCACGSRGYLEELDNKGCFGRAICDVAAKTSGPSLAKIFAFDAKRSAVNSSFVKHVIGNVAQRSQQARPLQISCCSVSLPGVPTLPANCPFADIMALALRKRSRLWKFLLLFCICYFLETITFTYLISAVQSIERQFQIPSRLSGTLIASSDIGYIPTVVLLAHFGSKGRRARWIGFGCLLISLACFLISLPGLTFPAEFSVAFNASALEMSMPVPLLLHQEIDQPLKLASHPQVGCAFKGWVRRSGLAFPDWATDEAGADRWNQSSCSSDNQTIWLPSSVSDEMVSLLKSNVDYATFARLLEEKVNVAYEYPYLETVGTGNIESLLRQARRPQALCSRVVNHFRHLVQSSTCETKTTNQLAFVIVLMGIMLIGVGHSMPWTLGMPLIDDSVKKRSMPYYIAGVFFIRILGPVLGFLVGSLCNSLYYNLKADPEIEPTDVNWIGAWWIGFLLIAVLLFVPSLLLFCFPHVDLNSIDERPEKTSPTVVMQRKGSVVVKTVNDGKPTDLCSSVGTELKNLSESLLVILRSPVYTFCLFGRMLDVLAFKGFFVFHSKYLEAHYGLPQYKANVAMGIAGTCGFAVGNIAGGYIMRKLKLDGRKATAYVSVCGIITVLFSFVKLTLGCTSTLSSLGAMGRQNDFNFTSTCNEYCHCDGSMLLPVCSSSGTPYFSPCHAGCQSSQRIGSSTNFSDCFCLDNGTVASRDYCQDDCGKPLAIYVFLLGISGLIAGTAVVPGILIVLRSVPAHLKSLSLGVSAFIVSLFSTFPSPIIFGYVIDGTCLLWSKSCGQKGSCSIYDTDQLRTRYFSLYGVLRLMSVFLDIGVFYYAKNLKLLEETKWKEREERSSVIDSVGDAHQPDVHSNKREDVEKKDRRDSSELSERKTFSPYESQAVITSLNEVVVRPFRQEEFIRRFLPLVCIRVSSSCEQGAWTYKQFEVSFKDDRSNPRQFPSFGIKDLSISRTPHSPTAPRFVGALATPYEAVVIPADAKSTTIDLYVGKDIAWHLRGYYKWKIWVMNSQVKDNWLQERRARMLLFVVPGKRIGVNIRIEGEKVLAIFGNQTIRDSRELSNRPITNDMVKNGIILYKIKAYHPISLIT
uniref:Kazal-like domain-containing protein n=1 Tax=Trichuris muris TaxID=70415 RepID=A0A5S6R479_TRIMR